MKNVSSILTVFLFCLTGLLASCNMSSEERELIKTPPAPAVTDWSSYETFTTVKEVDKVEGVQMGRVIVQRRSDSVWLSVAVIPFRKIPIGSENKRSHGRREYAA